MPLMFKVYSVLDALCRPFSKSIEADSAGG